MLHVEAGPRLALHNVSQLLDDICRSRPGVPNVVPEGEPLLEIDAPTPVNVDRLEHLPRVDFCVVGFPAKSTSD